MQRILIANRGEIAGRVARAVRELGHAPVIVAPQDDRHSHHLRFGDEAVTLPGQGPAAYLDIAAIIAAAREAGAGSIHPGYGFLSESAQFARACADAGLVFIGPSPSALALLGDKTRARSLAEQTGVPVPQGRDGPVTLEQAHDFLASLGPGRGMMIKAIAGGGGRGTHPVRSAEQIDAVFARCKAEATAAFGSGELYLEELIERARHVEVQIIRDHSGAASHVFERECTLQRRRQKLVEVAPSPWIDDAMRAQLFAASHALAEASGVTGLTTFEFLVSDPAEGETQGGFVFIEANPRLQVEHTVSEEISGIDLVQAQIEVAFGRSISELAIPEKVAAGPRGFAVQLRINAEAIEADGSVKPATGELTLFEPPMGPGIRIDGCGHRGFRPHPAYDALLAKLVVHAETADFAKLLGRARIALEEFRIVGCASNQAFLAALLDRQEVREGHWDTELVDRHMTELAARAVGLADRFAAAPDDAAAQAARAPVAERAVPDGMLGVKSPIAGVLVSFAVSEGERIGGSAELALVEAMKMQHAIPAPRDAEIVQLLAKPGAMVGEGELVAILLPADGADAAGCEAASQDPDHLRPDLAALHARKALLRDEARPEATAKMHARGRRTARENVADLCDAASFVEFGGLAIAAQRARRSADELRRYSPADGMIAGVGSVNGESFAAGRARCAVMAYDYSVFAGTQGAYNHKKKDHLFELAHRQRLPLVMFAGGGGGRPGETDIRLGLDVTTFGQFGKLKGQVPIIAIVCGPCFAGNAALAGCADIIIATRDANLGMGGPAMIEGGGLGAVKASEIGPAAMQAANGVVDILVDDGAEAVRVARQCLAAFQGKVAGLSSSDPRLLRSAVPENRLRVYDVRRVIEGLVDAGSFIELKGAFGQAMVTGLARIDGTACGFMANNPANASGAINADAAEKASDFLALCESWRLPVISLCDTPGFMVGLEAERQKQVKQSCRLFTQGANLSVPLFTIVLRKAYGLGAQAMAGGSFRMPVQAVSWPTGEFGAMGFEGAVALGFRKELEAIADPAEKEAFFQRKLAEMYAENSAIAAAEHFEIDDVIDPAETRDWLILGLATARLEPR